jgi:hypothetical protein
MTTFRKRLPIYEPALGIKFLQQIQVDYNMDPDLKMMTEKLQLLVFTSEQQT